MGGTDLGNGFTDHGVATPVSNHRGTVVTMDGQGRDVALVWLFDHRGGYALLLIDAETGDSEQYPTPFPPGGDCPYASLLSSRNRYYTHFNSHFAEFDPVRRAFTFHCATAPQMAMGMTEDDQGRIWAATYPDSGVVCFDPGTGRLRDYGHVYHQNWRQYQRYVAADQAGWVYFAVGNTASQIVALDPDSGQACPLFPEEERGRGSAYVYRDLDGKVYGVPLGGMEEGWYALYQGKADRVGRHDQRREKPIITGSQALFHVDFPTGRKLRTCDLVDRVLAVDDPATGQTWERRFAYTSEGAHVMGLALAPDQTICGGTAFPMRFFRFDPATSTWTNRASYGQWNTVARQGDRFFVGGYGAGFLLEWDPSRPWEPTEKDSAASNPRYLTECEPAINRPHCLLAHPNGNTVVLAGTPGYGYTGGGLLFWDRQTRTATLVEHTDLVPDHSTMSLVALSGGKLLGGTTTGPGTGGEKKAEVAELYLLDLATRAIEWRQVLFLETQEYTALHAPENGLVYGVADRRCFFVFDPGRRQLLHAENTHERFGLTPSQQGPRVFVRDPEGRLYLLFEKGIARLDLDSFGLELLAVPPVTIGSGGDVHEGRIYFSSGSHLCSYQIPK
jgi:hypothetical protein